MTLIRVNSAIMKSAGSKLKTHAGALEQPKNTIQGVRRKLDSDIQNRNNIGNKLKSSYQSIDTIENKLKKLAQILEQNSESFAIAEEKNRSLMESIKGNSSGSGGSAETVVKTAAAGLSASSHSTSSSKSKTTSEKAIGFAVKNSPVIAPNAVAGAGKYKGITVKKGSLMERLLSAKKGKPVAFAAKGNTKLKAGVFAAKGNTKLKAGVFAVKGNTKLKAGVFAVKDKATGEAVGSKATGKAVGVSNTKWDSMQKTNSTKNLKEFSKNYGAEKEKEDSKYKKVIPLGSKNKVASAWKSASVKDKSKQSDIKIGSSRKSGWTSATKSDDAKRSGINIGDERKAKWKSATANTSEDGKRSNVTIGNRDSNVVGNGLKNAFGDPTQTAKKQGLVDKLVNKGKEKMSTITKESLIEQGKTKLKEKAPGIAATAAGAVTGRAVLKGLNAAGLKSASASTSYNKVDAALESKTSYKVGNADVNLSASVGKTEQSYSAEANFDLEKGNINASASAHLAAKGAEAVSTIESKNFFMENKATAGKAELNAAAKVSLMDNKNMQLKVNASVDAEVAALQASSKARWGTEDYNAGYEGKATVGYAKAAADLTLDSEKGDVGAAVKAMAAAAHAGGSVDANLGLVKGSIGGEAYAGAIGVDAKAAFKDGKFEFEVGAALGIGGKVKGSIGIGSWGKKIEKATGGAISSATSVLSNVLQTQLAPVGAISNSAKAVVSGIKNVGKAIKNGDAKAVIKSVANTGVEVGKAVYNGAKAVVKGAVGAVKATVETGVKVAKTVVKGLEKTGKAIEKTAKKIWKAFTSW